VCACARACVRAVRARVCVCVCGGGVLHWIAFGAYYLGKFLTEISLEVKTL
jgi:hypothetical protein